MIELEHLPRPAGPRHVLDRPAGRAREPLQRVGLAGAPRHLDVALGMEEDEAAHGRDADGRRERHAEQARAQVDLTHVDEDVLRDGEPVDVALVAAQRRLRLAAAVAEVPGLTGEPRAGGSANLGKCREGAREFLCLGHGGVLYASPRGESWYTAAARTTERLKGILTMEIGCHLPTTQAPETMGDALVTFAREAERLNVASLWVSDHVIIPKVSTGYGRG